MKTWFKKLLADNQKSVDVSPSNVEYVVTRVNTVNYGSASSNFNFNGLTVLRISRCFCAIR